MPSTPFVGEIMPWAGNFAPVGWLPCEGQLLSTLDFDVLFALIGTTYGGNGQTTFGLPDLRGRTSIHSGTGPGLSNYFMGQTGGTESVSLTAAQIPAHTHALSETPASATSAPVPNNRIPAATASTDLAYGSPAISPGVMAPVVVSSFGTGPSPHENRQPHLAINFCIAYQGLFPIQ